MASNLYCIIEDYDGHWYVCQASKRSEAEAYFADPYADMPEWLIHIPGDPSRVVFPSYELN